MKFLLVLLVVLGGAWLLLGRKRGGGGSRGDGDGLPGRGPADDRVAPAKPPVIEAVTMVACAHCGVHLPAADLLFDTAGRPFCSDAHLLAGPR